MMQARARLRSAGGDGRTISAKLHRALGRSQSGITHAAVWWGRLLIPSLPGQPERPCIGLPWPPLQEEVTRAYLNNYITCFMVPEVLTAFACIPQIMMWCAPGWGARGGACWAPGSGPGCASQGPAAPLVSQAAGAQRWSPLFPGAAAGAP